MPRNTLLMHHLTQKLFKDYLPSIQYFMGKTQVIPSLHFAPDIIFTDGINVELERQQMYRPILRFHDHCVDRDGYDWIIQTVGLNKHSYQLLRLRYVFLRAMKDYRNVHLKGPSDVTAYLYALLREDMIDDVCRNNY